MNFDIFFKLLTEKLQQPLPGADAHIRLAPAVRQADIRSGIIKSNAKDSAVLILLYIDNEILKTAVILRNEYDGPHSGQISLPGGKKEAQDKDLLATALRETSEELGIDTSTVKVLGKLSRFYVSPSNFIIEPFVAYADTKPQFNPDITEVQKVIEIDVLKQLRYENVITHELTLKNGYTLTASGFEVDGEFLWGATAMIFSEFMQVIGV